MSGNNNRGNRNGNPNRGNNNYRNNNNNPNLDNNNNNNNNNNNGRMGGDTTDEDDMIVGNDGGGGDFDENDKKIISLYEVINELIEECKYRTQDLLILQQSSGDNGTDTVALMEQIEERNDISLQQIFQELELKEKKLDDDDDDEDEDDEDETDQGWEIYNTVVQNLNNYMEVFAESIQKIKELKQQVTSLENPTDNEISELELVIEEQTTALEETMRKNDELEKALTSVLTEYSNKINMSNDEIANLHAKLSQQNGEHQQQLRELRAMYETKINELQSNNEDEYKEEVRKLLDTLVSSRGDFKTQIDSLTNEMSQTQRIHHRKIMRLMSEKQAAEDESTKWEKLYNEIKEERESVLDKVIDSLDCIRGDLDIDDEEEYFYLKKSTMHTSDRQSRLKQRSHHKDRSQNRSDFASYHNTNTNTSTNTNQYSSSSSHHRTASRDNKYSSSSSSKHSKKHSKHSNYAGQGYRDENSTNRSHSQRSSNNNRNDNNSYYNNNTQYTTMANGGLTADSGHQSSSSSHHHHSSSKKSSKKTRSVSPHGGGGGGGHGGHREHGGGGHSRTSSKTSKYKTTTSSSNANYNSSNHNNYNYSNYSNHTHNTSSISTRNRGNSNSSVGSNSNLSANQMTSSYYSRRNVKGQHAQGSSFMTKGSKKSRVPESNFD